MGQWCNWAWCWAMWAGSSHLARLPQQLLQDVGWDAIAAINGALVSSAC